jgi:hypothetical protein
MFKTSVRFILFYCLFLLLSARAQLGNGAATQELTEEQARSLLRTKVAGSAAVEFVTLRKFEATPNTRSVAEKCLDEAKSRHIEMYGEGVLVNLFRTGGFVVLEFDAKTQLGTHVHLVTLNETGSAAIHSEIVEGQVSRNQAVALSRVSESFSNAVLPSVSTRLNEAWRAFGAVVPPTYIGHNDQDGYFAIPSRLTKFTAQPDELMEISALHAALGLWAIRYAPSLPIFAASPYDALKMAHDEQFRLIRGFLEQKKEKPDSIYALLDLDSIDTHDKLRERIQRLRELNTFLNQHSFSPASAKIREANISIAMIPLFMGVAGQQSDRVFAVMSASGMISEWTETRTGEFVLTDVSEGGD